MIDAVLNSWMIPIVGGIISSLIASVFFGDYSRYRRMVLGPLEVSDQVISNFRILRFAVIVDLLDIALSVVIIYSGWYGPGMGYLIRGIFRIFISVPLKIAFIIFFLIRTREYYLSLIMVANEAMAFLLPYGDIINFLPLYHYCSLISLSRRQFPKKSRDEIETEGSYIVLEFGFRIFRYAYFTGHFLLLFYVIMLIIFSIIDRLVSPESGASLVVTLDFIFYKIIPYWIAGTVVFGVLLYLVNRLRDRYKTDLD